MNINKESVMKAIGTGLIVIVSLAVYDQFVKPMINAGSVSKPMASAQ
jgi:hypothetical protein